MTIYITYRKTKQCGGGPGARMYRTLVSESHNLKEGDIFFFSKSWNRGEITYEILSVGKSTFIGYNSEITITFRKDLLEEVDNWV